MKFVLSAILLLISTVAMAQDRVDQREQNQEKRIEKGEANGSLTKGESRRLERQQKRIGKSEAAAEADGKVTKREQARLNREQNRASRNIARKKHNARGH